MDVIGLHDVTAPPAGLSVIQVYFPPLDSQCYLLVREAELLGFTHHLRRHGALILVGRTMLKRHVTRENIKVYMRISIFFQLDSRIKSLPLEVVSTSICEAIRHPDQPRSNT